MKKLICLLVVFPALCLATGYGAGKYLRKSADEKTQKVADLPQTEADKSKQDSEHEATDNNSEAADAKPIIVKIGQIIIPVYKARSVTYIVTNLGVTVSDMERAKYYNLGENGARLRAAIFLVMKLISEGHDLRGASIDTAKLSHDITAELKPKFEGVSGVMFLNFYKKDIARS